MIVISILIIGYLIYNRTLSLNIGIIISLIVVIIYPLILAVLPSVIDYGLQAKANLGISNIEVIKKYEDSEKKGYVIKASVTNKGRKNSLNLTASVQVEDSNGRSPNLLYVNYEEINGEITNVTPRQEPMKDIGYAWEVNNKIANKLEKLRQNDEAKAIFPHQEFGGGVGVLDSEDTITYSSEVLILLQKSTNYKIIVEVKGEDSEGCTVAREIIKKITL